MEYFVNTGIWGDIFAVPKTVVDNFIKLANEASLKVLLYVLKNSGKSISVQEISAALNISESSVEEAFVFWENANVLAKTCVSSAVTINSGNDEPENIPEEKVKKIPGKKRHDPGRSGYSLTPSEISSRIEGSEEIRCLFTMTESAFGRPLTHTEHRSLIWMHDYLGLPTDVILMLIAYCMSIEKESVSYIEKVACGWAEQGINTLESAQAEVKRLEESRSFNGSIMKIFSMNRRPTSKQQKFIDLWRSKSYSLELIEYAYEKTIEAIDKLSFPYINSILENWNAAGIITKEMVDRNDEMRKNNEPVAECDPDLLDYKSLVNNFGD
ncbi:MAG: DnaD domain protein [Porcipelethomonas sp.]